MPLIKIDEHLVKIGGKLMALATQETTEETPGLYDKDGNLVKTWDELVSEGLVTVE